MACISIDHHPTESGFAVICDADAKRVMPNFPDHIAFWGFKKWKDALDFAAKLQKISGGKAAVYDERPVCWDLPGSKSKILSPSTK